ncbi:MAG: hypothetical protein PUC98_05620 [Clostridiales bacterium]|nr:hypothetical protein [Clostridiales bacterium]
MNKKKDKNSILLAIVWMLIAAVMLSTATYAWFSSNQKVGTTRIRAYASAKELSLQLSDSDGGYDSGNDETDISQVNEADLEQLMPVSTADLEHFFYSTSSVPSNDEETLGASGFVEDENEKYFYHGVLYMNAYAVNQSETARMALYFSKNPADDNSGKDMLYGARLGLKFDDSDPVIFSLTADSAASQVNNTYINGSLAGEGVVLTGSGETVSTESDPSVQIEDYVYDAETGTLPEQPIAYLELNHSYKVDVYYYLEGCDPDCTDDLQRSDMDMNLYFYGVLTEDYE